MMMIPKEGIVCFIVFLDNKNIWFSVKNQVSISTIEKVMIILLILCRPFWIFRCKINILEWQLYIGPDIIMG